MAAKIAGMHRNRRKRGLLSLTDKLPPTFMLILVALIYMVKECVVDVERRRRIKYVLLNLCRIEESANGAHLRTQ